MGSLPMTQLHRLGASLLLATLVAGGLLAPPLHRALHGREAVRERVAHVAQSHHHAEEEHHGAEWAPPCAPAPPADDLACVLCKGLSACEAAAAPPLYLPVLQDAPPGAAAQAHAVERAGGPLNRGPPREAV